MSTTSVRRITTAVVLALSLAGIGNSLEAQQTPTDVMARIGAIVAQVSADTLMERVRELCGEKRVRVLGMDTIITNRFDGAGDSLNNELAGDYIEHELLRQGLLAGTQLFGDRGRNILAIQRGVAKPDIKYIICAHYDAAFYGFPAADDNASGTAAVLEAVRLLSRHSFDYTIEYILWDAEERGLVGSRDYARAARARGDSILGVINLDMIGWDSDGDARTTLQYNLPIALPLIDAMRAVNDSFAIGLDMVPELKSSTPSDSYSFAQNGYPAFLFIEDFKDFTPHYHKATDSPSTLNVPFFTQMTKAAVGALALLAGLREETTFASSEALPSGITLHTPAPHPFAAETHFSFTLPAAMSARLEIFDLVGRRAALLADGRFGAGRTDVAFDASALPPGMYFLRLTTPAAVSQRAVLHFH